MVPAHEKLSAKTRHPHAVFGISQRTLLLTLEITQHYETQVEFNFRETETKLSSTGSLNRNTIFGSILQSFVMKMLFIAQKWNPG